MGGAITPPGALMLEETLSRVPFHQTKRGTVPNDFLRVGAPPQTMSALFTIFIPARQTC